MAAERKVCKRQSKYKNILKKDFGLLSDNKPSKYLMICNAGLVNNCQREYILNEFNKFGKIDSIVMPEGKSYCFVSFQNESSAVECYETANGKNVLPCINGPLYLLFINEIPKDDSSNNFGDVPSGLHLIEDFVTESEEISLLNCIFFDEPENLGELKNRLVKHYGYEFLYGCNNIDRNSPLEQKIPEQCNLIFDRIEKRGLSNLVSWRPDQLTVNRYKPGQGIPPHIDTHSAFEDPIMSLSLGSDSVMDFKRDSKTISVILPKRSLLIMSNESRYAWSHCICPRKSDVLPHPDGGLTTKNRGIRTSLTFRRIKHSPCNCSYPKFCDSQAEKYDISDEVASSIENTYVRDVYNKISEHFSSTRHKPWPNVLNFVKSFPPGSIIVDIGCGNGKYFGHSKNIIELGLDQCHNLIEICKERGFEGVVSNCLLLPIKNNIADCVICIAVIHHLATNMRRMQAIREMIRIVRVGGKILIYAWAKNQSANNKASSYLKQSRKNRKIEHFETTDSNNSEITKDDTLSTQVHELEIDCQSEKSNMKLPLHENRTSFQHQDLLVPWKLKKDADSASFPTFLRYYHVFEENELEELCKSIDDVEIERSYYDQGNWCVILIKNK